MQKIHFRRNKASAPVTVRRGGVRRGSHEESWRRRDADRSARSARRLAELKRRQAEA